MDDLHGPSLPFTDAQVLSLDDEGHFVCAGPMMTGTHFYMGGTAVLLIQGARINLNLLLVELQLKRLR